MSELGAAELTELFRIVALRIGEARAALGELDGAIGDADHGTSMAEGFAALVRALSAASHAGTGAGDLFPVAAQSFLDAVGATTGPLYASAFLAAGQRFRGFETIPAESIPDLIPAFAEGIALRGKASPGDKTMLDVWRPAARAVAGARAQGAAPLAVLDAAVSAAEEGRDSTRAMIAALGRAARLGERTLGHIDPGAASAVVIIAALREGLAAHLSKGTG